MLFYIFAVKTLLVFVTSIREMKSHVRSLSERMQITSELFVMPVNDNSLTSTSLHSLNYEHRLRKKYNEIALNNVISKLNRFNYDNKSIHSFNTIRNGVARFIIKKNGIQCRDTMKKFKNMDYTRTANIDDMLDILLTNNSSMERKVNGDILHRFAVAVARTEREFYLSTFILTSSRKSNINGISFVQSALALQLLLTALSTETAYDATRQINNLTGFNISTQEKIACIKYVMSRLPVSSDVLTFRWSSRLVMNSSVTLSNRFRTRVAPAFGLRLQRLTDHDATDADSLTVMLNDMVAEDSNRAMHDIFDLEDLSGGVHAALLSTIYVRAQWRSAPTLLNGTRLFYDADDSCKSRPTRMFRINDVMGYADLDELNAQVVEIQYAARGLSLVMVIPRRGHGGLTGLAARLSDIGSATLARLLRRLCPRRIAVTMPLYTLRMTLSLPDKLQYMGLSRLVTDSKETSFVASISDSAKELKISQAVQTIMFGNEAGRNAFKDDGTEWDEKPELELVVNRPYAFFVRWRDITLLNGHFVL